jgi:hypothetical protein
MTPRSGRIGTNGPAEKPGSREIPCIFPADQGFGRTDEFAPDCLHRQLVRAFGGGEGRGAPEPETAGSGFGRRRSRCLSLLPGWAVRFRFRFAPAKAEADLLLENWYDRQTAQAKHRRCQSNVEIDYHERKSINAFRPTMFALLLALTVSGGLPGCGGGGAKIDARTMTLGQELEDLESAREKGLLTEKEYNQKRKVIMQRY